MNNFHITNRLIFVTDSVDIGGSERAFVSIANGLAQMGIGEIKVALFRKRGQFLNRISSSIPLHEIEGHGFFLKRNLQRLCAWLKFLYNQRPACVLSFLEHVNLFVLISSFVFSKIKFVVVEQCTVSVNIQKGTTTPVPFWKRILRHFLYIRAHRIIAISHGIKEEIQRTYYLDDRNVVVIPNPIECDRISQHISQPKLTPFQFVYFGRIVKQKNIPLLLESFTELVKSFPGKEIKLNLIGDGPLRTQMEELSSTLGIDKHIRWYGFLIDPWAEVAKCHCLVLSSNFEGFANVIIESLALGLPVISTDCPYGPREILSSNPHLGLIVPPNGVDELTKAMRQMVIQYPKWKKKSSQRVQFASRYSLPKIARLYEKVVKEALR